MPTPGKCTVKPFEDLLKERRVRLQRKEALKKKISSDNQTENVGELLTSLPLIESLDDLEEDLEMLENLEDQGVIVVDEISL